MAVKVSGVEVVSDSRQLANISGLDATTKASLESGLTNVNAATLDGIDSTGFATAAQGVTADSALQPEDIGVSVQAYNASTVVDAAYVHTDNNYTTAEKNKLAGIEAGATADQTKADIDALGINAATLGGNNAAYFTNYTDTAVSNLVDSAPTTLDTLNELAAALGDDPNFATTVTNSIATKLPLAGGTMTGDIVFNSTQLFDGRDVSVDGAKLDTIQENADVTDTANVTAAGALMDSEVTNLAAVKAFDPTDYATAAQGTLADSAVQPNDSPTFGNITATGNVVLGDGGYALFGDSYDLRIYHTGTESVIMDNGEGGLNIETNGPSINLRYLGQNLITAAQTAVKLYWANNERLSTNGTGIDVTGTVTANAFIGDGSGLTGLPAGGAIEKLEAWTPTAVSAKQFTWDESIYQGVYITLAAVEGRAANLNLRMGHTDGTVIVGSNYEYSYYADRGNVVSSSTENTSVPLTTGGLVGLTGGRDNNISGDIQIITPPSNYNEFTDFYIKTNMMYSNSSQSYAERCMANLGPHAGSQSYTGTAYDTVEISWSAGAFVAGSGVITVYGIRR